MKHFKILLLVIGLVHFNTFAQVGIGTTNPDTSAALHIVSNTSGMLVPRMSQLEKEAISNPANGLLVYQTNNTQGFYYYNGSAWVLLSGSDTDWVIDGDTMYNANTGNVGIGTTAPSSKFHLSGTTTIGNPGGTTNLLNENFNGYTVIEINNSTGCTVDGWENTDTGDTNANCASCTGEWLYIDSDETGCSQNATAIVAFTANPTSTSITISFDYRYRDFSGNDDFFRAYLYNETTNAQQGSDLINTTTSVNTSYTNTVTVVSGNAYSLRFEYQGIFDYGASIDNVLVTETSAAVASSYVFRLQDGQQQDGYVLTSDAAGNATWQPSSGTGGGTDDQTLSISGNTLSIENGNSVTLPAGGGDAYTFTNGLTESANTVRLGGTLTQDTTLDLDDRDLTFTSSTTATFPGEIIAEGTDRVIFKTRFDDNYINFGSGTTLVDGDQGDLFTDSGGDSYTTDFVVGFYNGLSGGTAISTGSIEYVVDGLDELLLEASSFNPLDNNGARLGGSSKRWSAVWATNGTIQTSDMRLKKNTATVPYGLAEILQLQPISYQWKEQKIGNTAIPQNKQKTNLGFSAQQLLELIPEVVETQSWYPVDEEGNYVLKTNETLGVKYAEIIPIVVKAIQEQQEEIETLKRMINLLKNQQ